MQVFYSQGIAMLFSQAPDLGTLRHVLERYGYVITGMEQAVSNWPEMEGPNLKIHCPHAPFCEVDICAFPWPDHMGTTGEPTMLTSAHAMGGFGPFTSPGAYERALQAPGYQEAAAAARQHQAFVRIRTSHFLGAPGQAGGAPAAPTNPPEELRFLLHVAAVLTQVPGALAFFNPNAELLMTLGAIAQMPGTSAELQTFPLEAFCRYRGCPVEGTWSLVDSIGMAQFGLRDHEFAWDGNAPSRQDQIGFMVNLLHYQVDKAVHMAGGHTTEGPLRKIWRAQERPNACMMPPRQVLHWTVDGAPAEPAMLAVNAPDPASAPASSPPQQAEGEIPEEMRQAHDELAGWLAKRDAIRTRAIAWVRSPQFRTTYYDDAHVPPEFKTALDRETSKKRAAELWQNLQPLGLQSPELWNQYQQLATEGQVLLAVPLMVNPNFKKKANMMLPCGLVVATQQTASEIILAHLFADAAYSTYIGEEDAGQRPGTARMLANDEFRLFYREMFPAHELHGLQLMYMAIMLRKSWMPPQEIPFVPLLAVPGPQGAVIQIPWHVAAGTPPLPGSMEPGRFAEAMSPDGKGAPGQKGGCANIVSLILLLIFGLAFVGAAIAGILIKMEIL